MAPSPEMVPRVSVLLPYYDAAASLEEALCSTLADGLAELEVIAIDDGSRDGGSAIVESVARRDPRVRSLRRPHEGLVAALQAGLSLARAPFIARMDADDVTLPGRFEAQLKLLEGSPRLAAVGSRIELDDPSLGGGMRRYVEWQSSLIGPDEHARDLFIESPLCHPSVTMRREALKAVGGYRDLDWPEDYDLWLRLDAAGWQLAKVEGVFLRWRRGKSCLTGRDPRYGLDRFYPLKAAFLAQRLGARASRDASPKRVVCWGAGPTGRRSMRALEREGVPAQAWIDIDPRKIGRTARDATISDPSALDPERDRVLVAVGSASARELIRAELRRRGFTEPEGFLCIA